MCSAFTGKGLLAVAIVAAAAQAVSAATINELPGNLFHQNGAPVGGNVSIAINGPQNQQGGNGALGPSNPYPVYGPSPILDGDLDTAWAVGIFTDGAMANVAVAKGYYTDNTGSTFVGTPFTQVAQIRIWAAQYQNDDLSFWQKYPQQVKVAYTTTANVNLGNAYSLNSGTIGQTPATWNTNVAITALNGVAPAAPANSAYATGDGWVRLDNTFISQSTANSHQILGYVDLSINIPVGATSILLSFGQDNTSTGNQGGLDIREIQAYVPEPSSLGLLALGGTALLRRRRA